MIFYQEPNLTLYQGHVLEVLKTLPAESVDCCITSPPYWGLRSYKTEPMIWDNHNGCEHTFGTDLILKQRGTTKGQTAQVGNQINEVCGTEIKQGNFCIHCNAWKGELGLEPTFELYISHLIQIFSEVKRALKKTGTCWVNISDSYANSGQGWGDTKTTNKDHTGSREREKPLKIDYPAKSLCLIPERFAISMVDAGWILRNDVIWYKANPMPESVKDRFTGTYEHVYFFVKSKKYWFEQQFDNAITFDDSIRDRDNSKLNNTPGRSRMAGLITNQYTQRNKRDVWEINTQPYKEAHFATFPEKLVETPILAGCPPMICKKCGKAREPIYDRKNMVIKKSDYAELSGNRTASSGTMVESAECQKIGYSDCGCNAGFESGTVLEPFAGSGTTLSVAKRLNRKSIGIELNPEYCKLAVKRIQEVPIPMEMNI